MEEIYQIISKYSKNISKAGIHNVCMASGNFRTIPEIHTDSKPRGTSLLNLSPLNNLNAFTGETEPSINGLLCFLS